MIDKKITRQDLTHPIHWCAVGFGAGLMQKAPGTWGSAGALVMIYFLPTQTWHLPVLALALMLIGVWAIHQHEKVATQHDEGWIVIDEVVGMILSLIFVPKSYLSLIVAFFLFRIFDVWKPSIIGYCDEKIHGAWGVMLDDVCAGLLTCACMHLLYMFIL